MKSGSQSLRRTIPSLQSLILFEAAARYLNFSKAAAELSITQPAVSHGIRQLEACLGHALFVRERPALSLTAQGQRLFASVSGGFASIAETLHGLGDRPRRDILVLSTSTVMATEWLTPRLSSFRKANPDLMVDLRTLDRDIDLTANNIDVHVRLGDGNWPGCEARPLWPEIVLPVCSPAYKRRAGDISTPDDLLNQRLIHYHDPYRYRIGWPEWLRAAGVKVPSAMPAALHVNDSLLAQKAAENGEGIALGWRPVIDRAMRQDRLVPAHERTLQTDRHFYAVTPRAPGRRRLAVVFQEWLLAQGQAEHDGA